MATMARWVLLVGMGVVILFLWVLKDHLTTEEDTLQRTLLPMMASQVGLMIALMVGFRFLPQLRILRVLPMKRQTITLMFTALPLASVLLVAVVFVVFLSGITAFVTGGDGPPLETWASFLGSAFLAGSLVVVGFSTLLRWGPMLGMVVLTVAVVAGVLTRQLIELPAGVVWAASFVFSLLGCWLVDLTLKTSAPWRLAMTASTWMKRWT